MSIAVHSRPTDLRRGWLFPRRERHGLPVESVLAAVALVLAAVLPVLEIGLRTFLGTGLPGNSGYVQHLALWIGCLPSRLAPALNSIADTTARLGARALIHPGVAQAAITFDEVTRQEMEELERRLREARTDARWLNVNEHETEPPRGLPLMQNLKRALDPQGLFAPGRFHGI